MTCIPESSLHFEICLLRQVPDSDSPRAADRSRRGFILPDEYAEQGRFADTIRTDKREARAFCNGEGQVGEQVERAEGFGEGGYGDEGHESVSSYQLSVGGRGGSVRLLYRDRVMCDT
jgi:hypothetical protein